MRQTNALVLGGLSGLVASERDYRRRRDQDNNFCLTTSQDALAVGRHAVGLIESLITNGDLVRLGLGGVADFLTGFSFGGKAEAKEPSPLPSVPELLPRPVLTEAIAVAPQQWPPSANDYDQKGNLKDPTSALTGQNVATGLALSFAEVRSWLVGLTRDSQPSSFVQAHFFRAARALSNVLADMATAASPLTEAQYEAAWDRLFSGIPSVATATSGVIYSAITDGSTVANSTTEAEVSEIAWPHGLLSRVGDCVEFIFGEVVAGNSTFTARVRLDSTGGTILAQQAVAVTTYKTAQHRVTVTRRADVGGNEIYEVASDNSDAQVTDVISLVPGTDHKLVMTGQWAAAAVGNTGTGKTAILRRL